MGKELRPENKQTTALGYISDTDMIVKASWSNFQHDGAAEFELSEKSPVPPAESAKDVPRGRTQVFNIRWIRQTDPHSPESDEGCPLESISDTEHWLIWNGYLDNANNCEDDCVAVNVSDMKLDNGGGDLETPEHRNVSATPNVPGWIQPTWLSN